MSHLSQASNDKFSDSTFIQSQDFKKPNISLKTRSLSSEVGQNTIEAAEESKAPNSRDAR